MLAGIALVVGPIDYAAGGNTAFSLGLLMALSAGLMGWLGGIEQRRVLIGGLLLGLMWGLVGLIGALGHGLGAPPPPQGWLLGVGGLLVGLLVGIIGGLIGGLIERLDAKAVRRMVVVFVLAIGADLLWVLLGVLVRWLGVPQQVQQVVVGTPDQGRLGMVLGMGLGVGLGVGLGSLLRLGLLEGLTDVPKLWLYMRLMGRPLLGYTLGYAALVGWFACVYASLYALNLHVCHVRHQVIQCDAAFSGINTPQLGDFLFFAVTIFPPIGAYSDLHPLGPWTHTVIAGELIAGVGYTTVVFAAILAYRTPAFDKLRRWNTQKAIARHMEFMKADLKAELHNAQKQTHTDLNNLDERMKGIEDQLKELTKQHSSAGVQGPE